MATRHQSRKLLALSRQTHPYLGSRRSEQARLPICCWSTGNSTGENNLIAPAQEFQL